MVCGGGSSLRDGAAAAAETHNNSQLGDLMSEQESYVSLRPSDAVAGGGPVQEGIYEITDAKFTTNDYNGTVQTPVPALAIEYKNVEGVLYVQYYSAGDARNFAPSTDGKRLRRVGSAAALNNATNCYQFLASVVNAGYPEDQLSDDISFLIGMHVEVMHEPTAERTIRGTVKQKGIIPVIKRFLEDPAKKTPGKKAAAKGNGAAATTTAAGDDSALQQKAIQALIGALREAPNQSLDKKSLPQKTFGKFGATDPDRSAALQLLLRDDFLSGLMDSGVIYDKANATVLYAGS
jgi:hypothetical protein